MPSYTVEVNQSTAFRMLPVGQEIVIALSSDLCVANEQNVKFCFLIKVIQSGSSVQTIGTFKTTPKNEGVGMIDISDIVQNYVSADNLATDDSQFKDYGSHGKPIPIHIIDKYSRAANAVRNVTVDGYVEYTDASGNIQQDGNGQVAEVTIINGYVKHSNLLRWTSETFTGDAFGIGFSLEDFAIQTGSAKKFLTNSPSTLYARTGDYGTLSYLQVQSIDETVHDDVRSIKIKMYPEYDAGGTIIGTVESERTEARGAYDGGNGFSHSSNWILYFGAFPANLRVIDEFNDALNDTMKSYTIGAYNSSDTLISELKTVNILCPNLKGFEQVRLTWLNQWGTWDYFTFNQKSVKTIATKGTTYQQLGGTWNGEVNDPFGYKGGKKSFRVNGTEKIKMNTDYVTEEHSEWFEELINSPEIYTLKYWESPRQVAAVVMGAGLTVKSMNQYATPVRLTTTSFTKKTVANDKLIQYTFEVEKSKTLRTQSI